MTDERHKSELAQLGWLRTLVATNDGFLRKSRKTIKQIENRMRESQANRLNQAGK